MTDTPLWHRAAALAAAAHRHQVRKDTSRTPYFSHPARVAMIVAIRFGCTDDQVLAAALLHDVIEDTTVDYDDLLKDFGGQVADIVACLSKDPRFVEHERERLYDEQLAKGSWQARLVKLADVYDNLADAPDDGVSHRMLEKLDRAVGLAGDGPHIADAITVVRQLADDIRAELC
ncbi:MAG: HD domain-containing protein [Phycisphaerales bacterium]